MRQVDVAIIGAGSAGLSARREVVKKTKNYVVIDDGILGTTCARVGCMPSKVLIQVAEDFSRRYKFEQIGIQNSKTISVDSKKVMSHVRSLRDRFVRAVDEGMSSWVSDEYLIRKRASFLDPHTLQVGDEKIHAKKIIIATGSSPIVPDQLKEFKDFLIDTNHFFEMEKLPKSMAVIGLGVIGIELGQSLHRLDVNVLGIARRKIIAGVSDPEIREYVCQKFSEQMNLSFNGIKAVEQVGNQLKFTTDKGEFFADKVLVTTGRSPNLKGLGVENLKCEVDSKGIPKYDPNTFQLRDHHHIFITGDVNAQKPILHEASDEGKIAGFNSVRDVQTKFKLRTPLEITFSDPNIAKIGKSFQELVDEKIDFATGKVTFEGQGRSIVKLKEIGLLHVYGEVETGKLLGAELFAPDGEHLAHLLAWAIQMNLTVNQVLAMPFYHPVVEEGLRTALRDLRQKVKEIPPEIEIYPLG